jgi:hypothetical protein
MILPLPRSEIFPQVIAAVISQAPPDAGSSNPLIKAVLASKSDVIERPDVI